MDLRRLRWTRNDNIAYLNLEQKTPPNIPKWTELMFHLNLICFFTNSGGGGGVLILFAQRCSRGFGESVLQNWCLENYWWAHFVSPHTLPVEHSKWVTRLSAKHRLKMRPGAGGSSVLGWGKQSSFKTTINCVNSVIFSDFIYSPWTWRQLEKRGSFFDL